jgi:hypothetical protein
MNATDGFDDAVLGRGLPAHAFRALREAGDARGDPARAMAALMRAKRYAPEHPAVIIALYRHHFFGGRLRMARFIARQALVIGAEALALPLVWREVPREPLPGARHDARTRFYLFVLKGYAYLSLRLDDDAEARDALSLLRALDPDDRVGGALLEGVRRRALARAAAGDAEGDGDDTDGDGDGDAPPPPFATGAAAWSRALVA